MSLTPNWMVEDNSSEWAASQAQRHVARLRDLFDECVLRGVMLEGHKKRRPGAVIEELGPESRAQLGELKGESFDKWQIAPWVIPSGPERLRDATEADLKYMRDRGLPY